MIAAAAAAIALAAAPLERGPLVSAVTPHAATIDAVSRSPAKADVVVAGHAVSATAGTDHVIRLTGLVAGRRYAYSVRLAGTTVARGSFRAAPAQPARFTFAVVGDYGSPGPPERAVARLIGSWQPDFVVTVGDNAYPLGLPGLLDADIFTPYAAVMRAAAWFPSLGNHDVYLNGGQPELAAFRSPGNGRWYHFGWGQAAFTVLDSTSTTNLAPGSPQLRFASRALPLGSCLRFAAWHHPPWSPHSAGLAPALRRSVVPLIERSHLQVVFLGHVHSYERSVVHHGVTYVTVGTGGAPMDEYGDSTLPDAKLVTGEFGALRVDVAGRTARFRFISTEGRVLDDFQRSCR